MKLKVLLFTLFISMQTSFADEPCIKTFMRNVETLMSESGYQFDQYEIELAKVKALVDRLKAKYIRHYKTKVIKSQAERLLMESHDGGDDVLFCSRVCYEATRFFRRELHAIIGDKYKIHHVRTQPIFGPKFPQLQPDNTFKFSQEGYHHDVVRIKNFHPKLGDLIIDASLKQFFIYADNPNALKMIPQIFVGYSAEAAGLFLKALSEEEVNTYRIDNYFEYRKVSRFQFEYRSRKFTDWLDSL